MRPLFLISLLLLSLISVGTKAEPIVGLTTNNEIIVFDTTDTTTLDDSITMTGLQAGETIVGMDYRTANGALVGVGSSSRIYTISLDTGVATPISTAVFTTLLSGTDFGVDFNPVADRLRIVSDTGQNLRINPDTGAIAADDTALSYDATDVNFGATPAVVALAYSNNFTGAATTTLYGIDATLNTLVLQGSAAGTTSPNGGVLFTQGSIGVDTTPSVGFDISPISGRFYISMTRSGQTSSELYRLRLGTGLPLTRLGSVSSATTLRDISIPPLESTGPTLTITTPSRSTTRTRSSRVNFAGTAIDNTKVSKVEYRTKKNGRTSSYREVSGDTSWSFTLTGLGIGRTVVTVKATDVFGNETTATRTIDRVRR